MNSHKKSMQNKNPQEIKQRLNELKKAASDMGVEGLEMAKPLDKLQKIKDFQENAGFYPW